MNIVDIAIKRPVTVWMFTLAVILFGLVSLSRLQLTLLPELSYPTLTIRTEYEGAAPAEIEQLVSRPIEEAIGVVKGVRTVTSRSKSGQSDVVLEFEWGTDMDLAGLEVREKLDTLQLPLDVSQPVLLRFNPSLDPVMRYGLGLHSDLQVNTSAAGLDIPALKRLRQYADQDIKRKLESLPGVASVQLGGGLEHQVQVLIDQQKAGQLNISADTIVKRLEDENVNISGGKVEDGAEELLVRTLNEFTSLDEIRNLIISSSEGRYIRLNDIATVTNTYKEPTSITRFNGAQGVEIAIYKEGDANSVAVADEVRKGIARLNNNLPADYQLTLVYDQSRFIANALAEVKSAAWVGGLLAMLVLFVFLRNLWPTLIISLSIPVSIIATFTLMYSNGISLNIMSLGGIALAIGLLVDNSIVVLENIDRHKRLGSHPKLAAAKGTKQVATAITASTLTTVAVFFPLVFVEGIAGQLFRDQALTVTFALIASLVIALTLIPMLAGLQRQSEKVEDNTDKIGGPLKTQNTKVRPTWQRILLAPVTLVRALLTLVFYYLPLALSGLVIFLKRFFGKVLGKILSPLLNGFNQGFEGLSRVYSGLLSKAIKRPVAVLCSLLALCLLSVPLIPKLGMELIPDMAQGEFYIEVNLPSGTQLGQTDALLADLANFAQSLPQVKRSYSLAGTGSLLSTNSNQGGDHWGKINLVLNDASADTQQKVTQALRNYLGTKPGIDSHFDKPALFTFATPLAIEISGYDLSMLGRYSNKLQSLMEANPRFADISNSVQAGQPELKIVFDHYRLAQLGLTAPDVSKLIATKIGGQVASQFNIDDRKVDILVRANADQRDNISDIGQMIVNPGQRPSVPLDAVADVTLSRGPSEITRIGQQRVALVTANLRYGDLGEAVAEINALIPELKLPANMQIQVTGQSEEMQSSFQSLMFALALAVFLVYLVMASQFESLLHPCLILFTVPLAAAGSIFGLYFTGTNVSVVVFIGLIMLAGIVVNNAIVLVDRINQLRSSGMEKVEAILEAAQSRLRPIVMTTLTTVLGLLPMLLSTGEGAEMRAPMAVTVIFGLVFASLLTLFVLPMLYRLFDRKTYVISTETDENGEQIYG